MYVQGMCRPGYRRGQARRCGVIPKSSSRPEGLLNLGGERPSAIANGISGDGTVVVGWQEHSTGPRQGARWVNNRQELFAGPDGFVGEAQGANSNGSIVVGQTCRFTGSLDQTQSAWIWTAREGIQCAPVPRPRLGGFIGNMLATSEDGRVIGGAQSFGLESEGSAIARRLEQFEFAGAVVRF
jgi:uncharacterized membrane protein